MPLEHIGNVCPISFWQEHAFLHCAMTSTPDLRPQRAALLQRLLPDGVPTLWCPLLTHYDDQGKLDAAHRALHLDFLAPSVRGFPGARLHG